MVHSKSWPRHEWNAGQELKRAVHKQNHASLNELKQRKEEWAKSPPQDTDSQGFLQVITSKGGPVIWHTFSFHKKFCENFLFHITVSFSKCLKNVQLPELIMSNCSYLTGFPNGVLMLATAPAAEDAAADAPADGKHYRYYK